MSNYFNNVFSANLPLKHFRSRTIGRHAMCQSKAAALGCHNQIQTLSSWKLAYSMVMPGIALYHQSSKRAPTQCVRRCPEWFHLACRYTSL